MSVLGKKAERPDGYALRDIREFVNIDERNRTLARKVASTMENLGLLKKIGGLRKQPRYLFTDKGSDKEDDYETINTMIADLSSISKIIGPKKQSRNLWDKYDDTGTEVMGTINQVGHYVLKDYYSDELRDFIELWPEWLGLLLSLISDPSNMKSNDLLENFFNNSAMEMKIDEYRKSFKKEEIDKLTESYEWRHSETGTGVMF